MLQLIAEHLVEIDVLPEKARILDIGCRGFEFVNYFRQRGHYVIGVDIDTLIDGQYFHCAISDFDGFCGLTKSDDAQATKINKLGTGIECYTLKSFSEMVRIEFWDLVKLDVEGSEYEIIMTLETPPAKQLSVEFHLHTHIYQQHEVDLMVGKLKGLGYSVDSHEYTEDHGMGMNFWSSLFILK